MKVTFKQVFLILVAMGLGTSSVLAGSVAVKGSHLKFDGTQYYRGGAIDVHLGSYGQKKARISGINKLSVYNDIKQADLSRYGHIDAVAVPNINWSNVNAQNLGASGKYMGVKGTHRLTRKQANKYKLSLVKFTINEANMQNTLNKGASTARKYMAREGKDARVCNTVWVVMTAQYANAFEGADKISISGQKNMKITATRGSKRTASVTLSKGTTFAYGLLRIKKWDSRKKQQVRNMEEDEWGVN